VRVGARRRGLDVALGAKGVDVVLRPRLDLSGLWVAAVIEINADERVGAAEYEPDLTSRPQGGLVTCSQADLLKLLLWS
jgi:hypothetical protein